MQRIVRYYRFLLFCLREGFIAHGLVLDIPLSRISRRVNLGSNVRIGKNSSVLIWSKDGEIVFEDNVGLGEGAHVTATNSITIREGTLMGRYVTISDNSHGVIDRSELHVSPSSRRLSSKGKVVIGRNVWIGDKVTILPGVQIGDGCIIGANTVVTKSIPPGCVVYNAVELKIQGI